MIKAASQGEQVQYISFKDLTQPSIETVTLKNILNGLDSKQWRNNFDALTDLRRVNRFYGNVLLNELLPQLSKHIIVQIQNLRSNNSKEALTLATEIIEYQNIQKIQKQVICPIVSALFNKTVSEKAFLKKQALSAVQLLPKKYNPYLLQQLSNQILSLNSQISELAAKILSIYIQNNKINEVNGEFLGVIIRTINGKRAVLQKKGKQIFSNIKARIGEEKLIQLIEIAKKQDKVTQQQYRALLAETKKQQKQIKSQPSLKDYLQMKKKAESSV